MHTTLQECCLVKVTFRIFFLSETLLHPYSNSSSYLRLIENACAIKAVFWIFQNIIRVMHREKSSSSSCVNLWQDLYPMGFHRSSFGSFIFPWRPMLVLIYVTQPIQDNTARCLSLDYTNTFWFGFKLGHY